ncbi:MAG: bifunctional diaminohydroxyphosphoribosylaminopyrimidine deaminase/5-amino-6-(5-phosphoribosylamino)uracil reductase RibD, partial [Cyclobacteriaceae bacterium]
MELDKIEHWMDFHINHSHEFYMQRALELAKNGCGNVSPNPLVGCVIVHDGKIVGEGWHKKYGEAHAEVNAIESVQDKSILQQSTLYVNLEPCSHSGKTPPCADLIIQHMLQKVIIANHDINPLVGGNGIKMLRAAGIKVITDILPREGYALNDRFFTYMEKKRPRIILKWAETSDGFIARKNNDSRWISDAYSRQLV